MSTLRGVAVVTGASGLTFTIAVPPAAQVASTMLPQNHTVDRDADIKYLKDGTGDSKSAFITDGKKRIVFEGAPYSTTIALARAEVERVLVAPGATVVFIDADTLAVDAAFTGAYLLESSKVARTNDGFLLATITCVQFDSNDLTLIPT